MRLSERAGQLIIVGWTFVLVAAVLWPLATPGMPLLRDMVVPPHPALTDAAWGLGESAARAAPQDAVLALSGAVTDAGLVMRLILVCGLIVGGIAAAELVRRVLGAGIVGQAAAVTMLLWNPYVVERLLQGHWSLVLAMALLPAIALASIAAAPWWRATAMAVAGLTPTGALLGGIVAVVTARSWRDRFLAFATFTLVSAPWLVATALGAGALGGAAGGGGAGVLADPAGAAAFAARAENWVGTLGALAGLGGIWNGQAVPASREAGTAALGVIALMALFAAGATRAWGVGALPTRATRATAGGAPTRATTPTTPTADGVERRAARRRLIILAIAAVVVPAALATGPGIGVMEWALETIPGAGLARDTQKWVALAVPGYVILAAAGTDAVASQIPRPRRWLAGLFGVMVVLAAVPDLPRAVAPITPTAPWPGWSAVSGLVAMDDAAVAVLPAGPYRIIGGRPVYDPAVKTLPAPVLGTGELVVSGVAVGGEGSTAARVEKTLLDAPAGAIDSLRADGVGWVLVESSPGAMGEAAAVLDRLEIIYSDEHLTLHRVPGAIAPIPPTDRTPAHVALALWLVMALSGPISSAVGRPTRRQAKPRRREPSPPS